MLNSYLRHHQNELLLVLQRPYIPLHTNGSETDIRDFVKKRKVSGGTRSDTDRQCRDTFTSLKITCRKLGISLWKYLTDRVSLTNSIPPLADILRERVLAAGFPLVFKKLQYFCPANGIFNFILAVKLLFVAFTGVSIICRYRDTHSACV